MRRTDGRGSRLLFECRLLVLCGAVAQLGERRVRNAEVGSSILLGSTNSTRVPAPGIS